MTQYSSSLVSIIREIIDSSVPTRHLHLTHVKLCEDIKHNTDFLSSNVPLLGRIYCLYHNITQQPTCGTCNVPTQWARLFKLGFKQYCSIRCKNLDPIQQAKAKNGIVGKYGVRNVSQLEWVQDKKIKNAIAKYGVTHPCQLDSIKAKTKNTNLNKYGVDHAMKLESIQDKTRKTNTKRYGVPFVQQHPDVKERTRSTNWDIYGKSHSSQRHISDNVLSCLNNYEWMITQHHTNKKTLSQIAHDLDLSDMTIVMNRMHQHGIKVKHYFTSAGEKAIADWIEVDLGLQIIRNDRFCISPCELDILIPSHNIAIEFCGLYWHSEQQGKNNLYHASKHEIAANKGIRLLTLYEDEWKNHQDIVKNKIKHMLGINNQNRMFARNLTIISVSSANKKTFFDQNHIQGNGPGSITYGLATSTGELIACMTFMQHSNGTYVLNRYATSCIVVGGFSRLLTWFKRSHKWNIINTFADKRWSIGSLYLKHGFVCTAKLQPDYQYVFRGRRIHKFNFRRKYLSRRLNSYDPTLSEKVNCDINGVLRLWDCGKLRFSITNSDHD